MLRAARRVQYQRVMRRFAILFGVVLVACAVWSGLWFHWAGQVRQSILSAEAGTPSLKCGTLGVGGFPFRFDVSCADAVVASEDVSAELPMIEATALMYRPEHMLFFAHGPVSIADAFSGAAYRLEWTSLEGSLRLSAGALVRAALVGEGLVLTDTLLGDSEVGGIGALDLQAVGVEGAAAADNANIAVFARLNAVRLPAAEAPINMQAEINVSELPAHTGLWSDPKLLPYWARSGGAIEVVDLALESEALNANLTGTLDPDETGLLDGTLALTSRGLAPLVQDVLPPEMVALLLGVEGEDGQFAQNLTITDSVVWVGILPMFQFQPLF